MKLHQFLISTFSVSVQRDTQTHWNNVCFTRHRWCTQNTDGPPSTLFPRSHHDKI